MPLPSNNRGSWNTAGMTGGGRVVPVGVFGGAIVRSVTGGSSPQAIFTHGRQPGGAEIARVPLVAGQSVYAGSAVECPEGIYMTVTGAPRRFFVEVLHAGA